MNPLRELSRLACLFVMGVIATLAAPEESQAAPAIQDVECTMVLTFCPSTGSVDLTCVGDCAPYTASCTLANLGSFQYCHCRGNGSGEPKLAPCTLVFDSATGSIFCVSVNCPPGACGDPIIGFSGECYEVYCLCMA